LKLRETFFLGAEIMYYVIDAQDHSRYIEALDYYKEIIKTLKELRQHPSIIILFHKDDPNLPPQEKKEIDKQLTILKYSITEISEKFDLYFFTTSIFDIKSLLDCYSSGLSLLFDKTDLICLLFDKVSKQYNAMMMALFDLNGITIGEYYKPLIPVSKKLKTYEYYIRAQKNIKQNNKKSFIFSDKFENNQPFSGILEIIRIGGLDFYLLFIVEDDKAKEKDYFLDTINFIKPQIEEVFQKIIPNIPSVPKG